MEENNMMKPNPHCPVIDINGFIEKGKEFDIDITLPDVYERKYHKFQKTEARESILRHFYLRGIYLYRLILGGFCRL